MAYAFGFGKDITDLIYSMRDWRLEEIKLKGGTPSRLALKPFTIWNLKIDPPPPGSYLSYLADTETYHIRVRNVFLDHDDVWMLGSRWHWYAFLDCRNDVIDAAGEPEVYVYERVFSLDIDESFP